ncbi:MAG TPA: RNA polymerase-binding protein DksA [Steroidobacteraceae bacterium]|nr:RNA polymerase-binding protein DksA [Steroidobacteraceae bacterium]
MPAKKTAPKPVKAKKAPSRPAPAARKAVARKPERAERAKATLHPRTKVAATTARRPSPAPVSAPRPTLTTVEISDTMRPEQAVPPVPPSPKAQPDAKPLARTSQAALEDGDDIAEPGSLLAGPRNVQPYIVKRGEQYMSKEQAEHFRHILMNWKRDLMEEVDRTVTHMKDEAANFPDPNDRATQEEEFSLELRTRDRERKLIRKIDEALKRIEDGSYGYCLETGEEIGIKRLEARPVATLSIEAQERRERRERQYGDRDDRYR